jgi:hypothetical protein
MTGDPKSYNFPEGELLRDAQLDNVGRAVLSLTKEICVLSDRVMVLEKVLEEKGVDVRKAVESYQPDKDFQEQLDVVKSKIVNTIFNDFTGSE